MKTIIAERVNVRICLADNNKMVMRIGNKLGDATWIELTEEQAVEVGEVLQNEIEYKTWDKMHKKIRYEKETNSNNN